MSDKPSRPVTPAEAKRLKARRIEEETRTEIVQKAAAATDPDRAAVAEIIGRAMVGDYDAAKYHVTTGMAALFFCNHNKYNRNWAAQGTKGSLEYRRRMLELEWKLNGDTIRIYRDGNLADGQGRLAALALAGISMDVLFAFGIELDVVGTIDDGRIRQGADTAQLQGITNARDKQSVLLHATNYLVRTGDKAAKIRSNVMMARELARNDAILETALYVGRESRSGISDPILKLIPAATAAYLMLHYGSWAQATALMRLRQLQSGMVHEPDGEKVPYQVCNDTIRRSRNAKEHRDRLGEVNEMAIVLLALKAVENNVSAISPAWLKAQIKKELPTPLHPSMERPLAAE